jgi:hypothetical protein
MCCKFRDRRVVLVGCCLCLREIAHEMSNFTHRPGQAAQDQLRLATSAGGAEVLGGGFAGRRAARIAVCRALGAALDDELML